MTISSIQLRFLQRLHAERPQRANNSQAAQHFSEHFHIGVQIGRSIEYTELDFRKVKQMLLNGGLPLSPMAAGALRSNAVAIPELSEKVGTQSPHADSIALKPISGACTSDGRKLAVPIGGYLVVTHEIALSIQATRLMVVENFETFRRLESYRWIDYQRQDVLAIFQGDNVFRQTTQLEVVRQRLELVWAFFDFDPAGLGMGRNLPRLERFVLPDRDDLTQKTKRARREDLFIKQMPQWGNSIESDARDLVSIPWSLMKSLKSGLPQEWMSSHCL